MAATLGMLVVGSALAGEFLAELGGGVLVPTLGEAGGIGFGAHLSPGYSIEIDPEGLMPMVVPELKLAYQTGSLNFENGTGLGSLLLGARGDVVVWKGEPVGKKKRKKAKLVGRDGFKSTLAVGGLLHGGVTLDLGSMSDVRGTLDVGLTADYASPKLQVGLHATQTMFLPYSGSTSVDGWLTIGVHVTLPIQKAIQLANRMIN